jgi:hypothetical protein
MSVGSFIMTDHLLQPHAQHATPQPRRRWSDINPAVLCAFAAALLAVVFHALPEQLAGVRTVLIATAAVTMLVILGLLFMERFGRAPNGKRHPAQRHDDWTRR